MTEEAKPPFAGDLDEARLAKGLSLGLPLATIAVAAVVGALSGLAMALLVMIGGAILGVIALFWASIRVLSGDAPLPAELEALDRSVHGVDALASRKKMLIRAIKDLETERDLGKLEDADFDSLAGTYRAELKDVLRQIDATLEPHRARAEEIARAHLARVGIREGASREPAPPSSREAEGEAEAVAPARVACPKCEASNEPDAKYCKECATPLARETTDEA